MERNYIEVIAKAYAGYFNYLKNEIIFNYDYKPWWENYFWLLILVSLMFFGLEWIKPWRKNQPKFRRDFWLDVFYMFFNFFFFSLVIYNALSDVFVNIFNDLLHLFHLKNIVAIEINHWPKWAQLLTLFIVRDFIHWWVHRWLHYNSTLWEFHKIHHSVKEMGFAAHLRFHWMETVIYRTTEYIPLAMIGFGIDDFFFVHMIALAIGHWNHANFKINIGPLRYIFNTPQMHIWHHTKALPESHKNGVNFGISLSLWDYIFRTNYIPNNGRDNKLGFYGDSEVPPTFKQQILYGFKKKTSKDVNIDK